MKIIDLLNKIANGEEVPKFKYYDGTYIYDKETGRYWFKDMWFDFDIKDLNDEVEIIEEDNKIKKLNVIDIGNHYNETTNEYDIITIDDLEIDSDEERVIKEIAYHISNIEDTINEIIDKINKEE